MCPGALPLSIEEACVLSTASPLVAISQAVRSKQFLLGCAGRMEEVVASNAVFKGAPLLRRKEGCVASMGATRRDLR